MRRAAIAGLYLAAAVLITWPLAAHLTARLGAFVGPGDPYLNLWILGWGLRAWTTDPASVFSGAVFDANIFHPAAQTLAYSDHLLVQSLLMVPVYAVSGDVVLCYNLLLIASIAASGMAMHLFVRSVTGSTAGAIAAGLAWACWPYRTAHLLHLQLQALYLLPLVWWALHRVAARRRWRDAALLAIFTALQALSSAYYGVMLIVALPAAALALAWASGQWRSRAYWTRLAAAGALAAVLVAPVASIYAAAGREQGFGRTLFEAQHHSAAWPSYTQVPPSNLLYGRTGLLEPRMPAAGETDRRHVEHQMFPGVVLLLLAGAGLWKGWRSDARAVAITAATLVVCGVILSLGPDGARTIYAWFYDRVPGFEAIRAPARFAVIAMSGLCPLAGLAMSSGGRLAAALTALMMLEFVNAPLGLAAAPPRSTETGHWLKDAPGRGAVLYLPLGIDADNTPFMVQSLEHGRPIVNGYSGQRPGHFAAVVDAISTLPSRDALAMLKELEVAYVVSPAAMAAAEGGASPLVARATVAEGTIYEVRWTPESEAAIAAAPGPAPPPPGAIPFRAPEEARYDVTWVGGPLNLSAGTITLRAGAPGQADRQAAPGAAWAFEATAVTARWVSTFFEANDRFRTLATAALETLVQTRDIHEGRRRLQRAYVYDASRREVRSADTPANAAKDGALGTPLAPGARDALAALYYVRTLDLKPGAALDLPVNEGGRGLSLRVRVAGLETIATPAGPRPAIRLEPTLTAQVERRRPTSLTVWLSADDRRVPLLIDLDAGFGRLRLVLVDYRT